MQGLKLAVLYGFYPHSLGLCGVQKKSTKELFLNYLSGRKTSKEKVRKALRGFEAAFSYYKLIAKSNHIKDPFNKEVVKAYWIGNNLLEKVSIRSLREMIKKEFSKPGLLSLKAAKEKAKNISIFSKPHHSFHVLAIGSVTGRIFLEGRLLDVCRIGWGKVIEYRKFKDENGLVLECQPLRYRNKKYFLGKQISKLIFWDKNLVPKIKIGAMVATHWGHIVQTLSKRDLADLKKHTQITIDSLLN